MSNRIIDAVLMLLIGAIVLYFSYFTDPHQWMLFRVAIDNNQQLYSLITANFTHFNNHHLIENLIAFVLIWFLFFGENCASYYTKLFALAISALATGLGIYLLTKVSIYSGLSGALHGMVICACLLRFLLDKDTKGLIVIIIVIAKIYIDYNYPEFGFNELSQKLYGDSMKLQHFLQSNKPGAFEVCAPSHLFGAVGGAITALLIIIKNKTGRKIIK